MQRNSAKVYFLASIMSLFSALSRTGHRHFM